MTTNTTTIGPVTLTPVKLPEQLTKLSEIPDLETASVDQKSGLITLNYFTIAYDPKELEKYDSGVLMERIMYHFRGEEQDGGFRPQGFRRPHSINNITSINDVHGFGLGQKNNRFSISEEKMDGYFRIGHGTEVSIGCGRGMGSKPLVSGKVTRAVKGVQQSAPFMVSTRLNVQFAEMKNLTPLERELEECMNSIFGFRDGEISFSIERIGA